MAQGGGGMPDWEQLDELVSWMEQLLQEDYDQTQDLSHWLKGNNRLTRLILRARKLPEPVDLWPRDPIAFFLESCTEMGMDRSLLFSRSDLLGERDLGKVIKCMLTVKRLTQQAAQRPALPRADSRSSSQQHSRRPSQVDDDIIEVRAGNVEALLSENRSLHAEVEALREELGECTQQLASARASNTIHSGSEAGSEQDRLASLQQENYVLKLQMSLFPSLVTPLNPAAPEVKVVGPGRVHLLQDPSWPGGPAPDGGDWRAAADPSDAVAMAALLTPQQLPMPSPDQMKESAYLQVQNTTQQLLANRDVSSEEVTTLGTLLAKSEQMRYYFAYLQNYLLEKLEHQFCAYSEKAMKGVTLHFHSRRGKASSRVYKVHPDTGVIKWGRPLAALNVTKIQRVVLGTQEFHTQPKATFTSTQCFTLHTESGLVIPLSAQSPTERDEWLAYINSLKNKLLLCSDVAPISLRYKNFASIYYLVLTTLQATTLTSRRNFLSITSIMHATRRISRPGPKPNSNVFLKEPLGHVLRTFPCVFWEDYFWTQVSPDFAKAKMAAGIEFRSQAWVTRMLRNFRDELLDWGLSLKDVKELMKWMHGSNDLPDAALFMLLKHVDRAQLKQQDNGEETVAPATINNNPFLETSQAKVNFLGRKKTLRRLGIKTNPTALDAAPRSSALPPDIKRKNGRSASVGTVTLMRSSSSSPVSAKPAIPPRSYSSAAPGPLGVGNSHSSDRLQRTSSPGRPRSNSAPTSPDRKQAGAGPSSGKYQQVLRHEDPQMPDEEDEAFMAVAGPPSADHGVHPQPRQLGEAHVPGPGRLDGQDEVEEERKASIAELQKWLRRLGEGLEAYAPVFHEYGMDMDFLRLNDVTPQDFQDIGVLPYHLEPLLSGLSHLHEQKQSIGGASALPPSVSASASLSRNKMEGHDFNYSDAALATPSPPATAGMRLSFRPVAGAGIKIHQFGQDGRVDSDTDSEDEEHPPEEIVGIADGAEDADFFDGEAGRGGEQPPGKENQRQPNGPASRAARGRAYAKRVGGKAMPAIPMGALRPAVPSGRPWEKTGESSPQINESVVVQPGLDEP
eukprot:g12030.t1